MRPFCIYVYIFIYIELIYFLCLTLNLTHETGIRPIAQGRTLPLGWARAQGQMRWVVRVGSLPFGTKAKCIYTNVPTARDRQTAGMPVKDERGRPMPKRGQFQSEFRYTVCIQWWTDLRLKRIGWRWQVITLSLSRLQQQRPLQRTNVRLIFT